MVYGKSESIRSVSLLLFMTSRITIYCSLWYLLFFDTMLVLQVISSRISNCHTGFMAHISNLTSISSYFSTNVISEIPLSFRYDDDLEGAKFTQPKEGYTPHASKKAKKNSIGNALPKRVLSGVFSEDYDVVQEKILDPRGPDIDTWNKIFFASCLTSLFVDPLFLLLPRAKEDICIHVSAPAEVTLTVIRSLADVFYIIHIFV